MVKERSLYQQFSSANGQLPPLESGDHLTRHEFERRYHAMPHLKKAELIEGVVYVPSPLRFEPHAEPHGKIMVWLGIYQVSTPGLRLGDNPTVRLDLDNEPQPGAVLLIDQAAGGQSRLSEDGYLEAAPELVVEIATSSVANDLYDSTRSGFKVERRSLSAATGTPSTKTLTRRPRSTGLRSPNAENPGTSVVSSCCRL